MYACYICHDIMHVSYYSTCTDDSDCCIRNSMYDMLYIAKCCMHPIKVHVQIMPILLY